MTVRLEETARGPRIVVPLGGADHVISIEVATELRDELVAALMSADDFTVVSKLRSHVAACPIGYNEGRTIVARGTSDADVVAWLRRLHELSGQSNGES